MEAASTCDSCHDTIALRRSAAAAELTRRGGRRDTLGGGRDGHRPARGRPHRAAELAGGRGRTGGHRPDAAAGQGLRHLDVRRQRQERAADRHPGDPRRVRGGDRHPGRPAARSRRGGPGRLRVHRPGGRADQAGRDGGIRDPDAGRRRRRGLRADPAGPLGPRAHRPAAKRRRRARRPAGQRRLRAQRAAGKPGLRIRRPRQARAARLACSGLGILLHLPAQPGGSRSLPVAGAAAVPGRQRAGRGDRGGGRAGRARADHPAQRRRGADRAALAQAGGGRSPAPARHRPEHPRPQPVHHPGRQLLPGRHRAAAARGGPGDLAAADPRHGAARGDADLRRAAAPAADRGLRDPHLRVRPGRRTLCRQRAVARRAPGRPDPAGPAAGRG